MTKHEAFIQVRKYYFCEALNSADTQWKRADILTGCVGALPKYTVTLADARKLYALAGIKARADYSVRKHKD